MLNKMGMHAFFPATRSVPFTSGHPDTVNTAFKCNNSLNFAPGISPGSPYCASKTYPHDVLMHGTLTMASKVGTQARTPLRSGGGNAWIFRSNLRSAFIESQLALNAGLNATFGQ